MPHKILIPLTLDPPSIINYSQFKTFLASKISKKAPRSTKYTDEFFPQNFLSKINFNLSSKRQTFDIDKILRINIQEKLTKKQNDIEKKNKSFFTNFYTTKVNKLKSEYRKRVHLKEKVRLDDIDRLEDDFMFVNKNLFTDNILKDCYEFLKGSYDSLTYLQLKYGEFVNNSVGKGSKITEFVNLRYGRDVFRMDVYENKCLYAEIYVAIRSGDYDYVEKLLEKYNFYFNGNTKGFVGPVLEYVSNLRNKKLSAEFLSVQSKKQALFMLHMTNQSSDKFKVTLLRMMSQSFIADSDPVIDTLEDFLFYAIITLDQKRIKTEIGKMFEEFPSESGKLFAFLLAGKNEEAIEAMFEGNFTIYECYFLMQNLIHKDIENFKYFVHLVFLIAKHFKKSEKKINIINSLQKYNFEQRNQLIVDNIIKYRMFDIIQEKSIDKEIIKILGKELKERNETDIILQNFFLFEDEGLLLDVYCSAIKDIIINSKSCDAAYLEHLFEKYEGLSIDVGRKAFILNNFFIFYKNRDEESFRKTIICGSYNEELDKDLLTVAEKVLLIGCDLFRKEKNRYCLEKILCFAGHFQFSNEIIFSINNEMLEML